MGKGNSVKGGLSGGAPPKAAKRSSAGGGDGARKAKKRRRGGKPEKGGPRARLHIVLELMTNGREVSIGAVETDRDVHGRCDTGRGGGAHNAMRLKRESE